MNIPIIWHSTLFSSTIFLLTRALFFLGDLINFCQDHTLHLYASLCLQNPCVHLHMLLLLWDLKPHRKPLQEWGHFSQETQESIACVKLTVLLKPQSVVRVTWTMHYTVFCWLPGPISSPGTPLGILAFQCQPFYSHLCPSQIEKLSGVCSRAPSPTPSLNSEEWHFLCLVCICFSVFIALEKAFTHSISHLNVFFLRLFKN